MTRFISCRAAAVPGGHDGPSKFTIARVSLESLYITLAELWQSCTRYGDRLQGTLLRPISWLAPLGASCRQLRTTPQTARVRLTTDRRELCRGFLAVVSLSICSLGLAQQSVLDRVKAGGKITIAHRESSVPFSYIDSNKKPVGYAVDLCLKLVEAVNKKVGVKGMGVEFLLVAAAERITAIETGKADLECGSTTNNAERRQRVAFTIPHFITGARLMVAAASNAERIEDFQGRKLTSTKGSTALKALASANRDRLLNITVVEAPEHSKAIDMLENGEVDGFVMDDVLLFGLAANRPDPKALKVVGKFLTTEPLAIMLPRNDPEFKKIIDAEMKRLILSKEIYTLYDKWFMQPIPPNGAVLKLPTSYLLRDFWKYPSDFVPL